MCYEAGRASVYKVLFFFSVQRRHKHCYHTAVSHTEQTEQQPCFSHPRVANDATFSYPEWSRWNSGMIVKIKSHQLKKVWWTWEERKTKITETIIAKAYWLFSARNIIRRSVKTLPCNIHPSSCSLIQFRVAEGLEPIPAVTGCNTFSSQIASPL